MNPSYNRRKRCGENSASTNSPTGPAFAAIRQNSLTNSPPSGTGKAAFPASAPPEIEGELLNTEQVRSSLARRLGIDIGDLAPPESCSHGREKVHYQAPAAELLPQQMAVFLLAFTIRTPSTPS